MIQSTRADQQDADAFAHSRAYLRIRNIVRRHGAFLIPSWRAIKRAIWWCRYRSNKTKFQAIYTKNTWACVESRSGEGSSLEATKRTREALMDFVDRHKIRVILDVPCGDFNWMQKVSFLGRYIGGDIVRELIYENEKKYANDNRVFRLIDLTCDPLPSCDLILSRDCLNHLSFEDIQKALKNIRKCNAQFVAATNFPFVKKNHNQESGFTYRALNLSLPPFCLPEPFADYDEEHDAGKHLAFWRVQDLRYP